MPHTRPLTRKKTPKRVFVLPDLEHAKSAVLSSLTSRSGQRTYDHAIREFAAWYCSEPRLAFNCTVVLRYRIHLELRVTPRRAAGADAGIDPAARGARYRHAGGAYDLRPAGGQVATERRCNHRVRCMLAYSLRK
jgi:hypothetical protein